MAAGVQQQPEGKRYGYPSQLCPHAFEIAVAEFAGEVRPQHAEQQEADAVYPYGALVFQALHIDDVGVQRGSGNHHQRSGQRVFIQILRQRIQAEQYAECQRGELGLRPIQAFGHRGERGKQQR